MKRKAIKYWTAALFFLILTCLAALAVHTGNIQVTVTNMDDIPVLDMTITLYTVVDEQNRLNPDFSKAGIAAHYIADNPHSPEYAAKLAQCAAAQNLTGWDEQTDENGCVYFDNVIEGIYLVVGTLETDSTTVVFDPFLVPIPTVINGDPDYSVFAAPKVDYTFPDPNPPGPKPDPDPDPWPIYGTVALTKVDAADPNKTLANVVFDLYRANGTLVRSYTTNANGRIFETLSPGTYYWLETRPAEGYVKDNTKHFFTISSGQTHRMTLTNTHAEVPSVFSTEHYAFVIGYDDGLVHPEGNITRAEMATIFFRMLSEETRNQYLTRRNGFSDVRRSDWYNTAISTMANMGAIEGYPDGTFAPTENITRAELIALAAHFDPDGDTTSSSFTDIEGHWAEDEINIAANNGWTLGNGTDLFNPDALITRAEAMALVNRVLQRLPETVDDLLPNMVTWPDNMDPEKWYYLAVQEASNSHDYVRKDNGYEFWTKLTKVPNWKKYER